MFNVDLVVKQGLANGGSGRGGDFSAFGAIFRMGQYFDDGHGFDLDRLKEEGRLSDRRDVFSGQGFLDAPVHAMRGERFSAFGQCLRGRFNACDVTVFARIRQLSHQMIDLRLFAGTEQVCIGGQRALRGQDHAVGIDLRLGQRARAHILLGG